MTDEELQVLVDRKAEELCKVGMVPIRIPKVTDWTVTTKDYVARHPDLVGAFIHVEYQPIVKS